MLKQCVGIKGSRNASGHSTQIKFCSRVEKSEDAAKLLLFGSVIISQVNGRSCGEMKDRTLLGFSPPFNLYPIGFSLP